MNYHISHITSSLLHPSYQVDHRPPLKDYSTPPSLSIDCLLYFYFIIVLVTSISIFSVLFCYWFVFR